MTFRPFSVIIQQASSSSTGTSSNIINSSGSTIGALTPIRIDSNGSIQVIDVSLDSSALSIVGVTVASVANLGSVSVITQGKMADVTTSFAVGDYVYVSKTGTLTNALPSDGVNGFVTGDFIIRVGVIAKNEDDSNKKDLFVNISVAGQL